MYPSPVHKQKKSNEDSSASELANQKEDFNLSSETHDLIQSYYEPRIESESKTYKKARLVLIILLLICFVCGLYASTVENPMRSSALSGVAFFTVPVGLGYFLVYLLIITIPAYLDLRNIQREKEIYLSYPPHVVPSVKEAYYNTANYILNTDMLKNSVLSELAKRYLEFERLSIEELRKSLITSGLLGVDGAEKRGPTKFDEGVLLAVYVRKLDKEKVAQDATRTLHKELSRSVGTSPNLQTRKHIEQQKDAVAQELGALEGEPDDSFNWSLKRIGGEVRVYTRGGDAVAASFTLPRGVYRLDIKDEESEEDRPPQRLRIEDAPGDVKISPPVKRGEIEITGEKGTTDTIPLY